MKQADLFIEQILLKERAPGNEPSERAALDRLRSDNDAILARYPASAMRVAVEAKMAEKAGSARGLGRTRLFVTARVSGKPSGVTGQPTASRPKTAFRSAILRAGPIAAAACFALAASFVYLSSPTLRDLVGGTGFPFAESSGIRVKGSSPSLLVYRKSSDGPELLANGTKARMNDVIQLRYYAGNDTWGAILSVDGNGMITQHFPDSGNESAPLEGTGEITLAFSYRLDDAPKFERFIFVTGTRSFSVADMKHDIANLARIHPTGSFALDPLLPGGTRETDVLLRK